jgi:hypothetical protein
MKSPHAAARSKFRQHLKGLLVPIVFASRPVRALTGSGAGSGQRYGSIQQDVAH